MNDPVLTTEVSQCWGDQLLRVAKTEFDIMAVTKCDTEWDVMHNVYDLCT